MFVFLNVISCKDDFRNSNIYGINTPICLMEICLIFDIIIDFKFKKLLTVQKKAIASRQTNTLQ